MLKLIRDYLNRDKELRQEALESAKRYFGNTPRHVITHEEWYAYQKAYRNTKRKEGK